MAINFTAMTWNVENLFPVSPNGPGPKDPATYDTKMENLAHTILAIAPDVLAVQEIGSEVTFSDLKSKLPGYEHSALSTHPDPRGIRVGVISKLPLADVTELSGFPNKSLIVSASSQGENEPAREIVKMGRGAVKVVAQVAPGRSITIVTTHLKSKLVTYPTPPGHPHAPPRRVPHDEEERARETAFTLVRRAAEATALRVFAVSLIRGNTQPLILLGDLNDGPEAVTTQLLLGPEDRSLAHHDQFDDVRLYNLADYLPPDHRYSRVYQKHPELIDHILVSYDLIFYRRQVDSFVQSIESITESLSSRRDATFPDHAPVFARFELPD